MYSRRTHTRQARPSYALFENKYRNYTVFTTWKYRAFLLPHMVDGQENVVRVFLGI